MISSVSGTVATVSASSAVVQVGGVGLMLHCTPPTLSTLRVGRSATLATSLVVREDSLTLFGFADDDERELFELLQTASGVGPRLAQAALAVHPPDVLRSALGNGDVSTLTQVPGIGKKGAERLVLELKDKIGPVAAVPAQGRRQPAWTEQVRQGLIGLGWSPAQADQAVAGVAETLGDAADPPPVPQLLRQAIKLLGKAR